MEFWKLAALDYLPTCDQGQTAPLEPAASDMFHVFGGAKGPKNGHMAMKTVLRQAQKFGTALTSLGQGIWKSSSSTFFRYIFAWYMGLLRHSFHIPNFHIYPANNLEVRAH